MSSSPFLRPFSALSERQFRLLYAGQAANLLGDALTWVALALLAYQLAPGSTGMLLAAALTTRVVVYVLVAPWAGVVADRVDRRRLLLSANAARGFVVLLLAFVQQPWQMIAAVLALNVLAAVFTPSFQATIPLVVSDRAYPQALALSGATYELLGVLGPGIAGAMAVFAGFRTIFVLDALTFAVSVVSIALVRIPDAREHGPRPHVREDVATGTRLLWGSVRIRRALLFELSAAVSGAAVLVQSVGLVRSDLGGSAAVYGGVMAAFGAGAAVAAFASGVVAHRVRPLAMAGAGAIVAAIAIMPAAGVGLAGVAALWVLAGAGQSWTGIPAQRLIADEVPKASHGRAFSAHFAWSHLWRVGAYPLIALLGSANASDAFLPAGLIALAIAGTVALAPRLGRRRAARP